MKKITSILATMLLCIFLATGMSNANELGVKLSGNKVFFRGTNESGQWWKVKFLGQGTVGSYVEYLEVEDYYSQLGAGLEITLLTEPDKRLDGLVGVERYELFTDQDLFFRTGLCLTAPVSFGEFQANVDLMFDDWFGVFPRYSVEMQIDRWWLNLNLGIGNVLGSDDGDALWIGLAW